MSYNAFLTIQWNGDKFASKIELGIMYVSLTLERRQRHFVAFG